MINNRENQFKEVVEIFEEVCEEVGVEPNYLFFTDDGKVEVDSILHDVEECGEKGYIVDGSVFISREKIKEVEKLFKARRGN